MRAFCFYRIFFIFFALSLFSCATSPKQDDSQDLSRQIRTGKFFKTELSNGIPIVIKESRMDQNFNSFSLIFLGGASLQNDSTAGIDHIIFSMLKAYSSDDASCQFFDECTSDYSLITFTCSKKSFEDSLSNFISRFFMEKFSEDEFDAVINAESEKINDVHFIPELFMQKVSSEVFAGLPNQVPSYPTKESLADITFEDVCARFSDLKNASSIRIAAVGDFDEKKASHLILSMEKSFGSLEHGESKVADENSGVTLVLRNQTQRISRFEFISDETVLNQFNADDLNHTVALGCFVSPLYSDSDYPSFVLATLIYDNILRHELLGVQNIAFSAGCAILPGRIQLGMISVLGTKDAQQTIQIAGRARSLFPSVSDLNRILVQYKKDYINQLVHALHASSSEMQLLVTSWIYLSDAESYTGRPALVNGVSSKEVCDAFEKYIKNAPIEWFFIDNNLNGTKW